MTRVGRGLALLANMIVLAIGSAASAGALSLGQILDSSPPGDWRAIDPAEILVMSLPQGRVVIELAPQFAPNHVMNVKRLARAGFFDGLSVVRAQDDYVAQWGDADSSHSTGEGRLRLKAEFDHRYAVGDPFVALQDPDTYAAKTGFVGDFPAARDPKTGLTWLTHCYGMVGAGRAVDPDSGGGAELYAVIGQSPRQLDRNVTLLGRVIDGMEILSTLPRGHGEMGFYQSPPERITIASVKLGSDLPLKDRPGYQVLRTDSATFAAIIQNRRFRRDDWYKVPAGRIDVCNVPLPVRRTPAN